MTDHIITFKSGSTLSPRGKQALLGLGMIAFSVGAAFAFSPLAPDTISHEDAVRYVQEAHALEAAQKSVVHVDENYMADAPQIVCFDDQGMVTDGNDWMECWPITPAPQPITDHAKL